MSNWGKAHENNTIGFGQGSKNLNGWGYIYKDSYSGETVLDPSVVVYLTNLENRVIQDSGTFEAKECAIELLKNI